ncbi:MAG: hypothetical protein R3277_01910 [Brumimicrobium sp.]|nr:hypothetical protein [Brumimicrobium sp.]
MNLRLTVIFFTLFFGVSLFLYFQGGSERKSDFRLSDYVSDQQVMVRLDLRQILNDVKNVRDKSDVQIPFIFYLDAFQKELENSGLNLEQCYFTHSIKEDKSYFYFEIVNPELKVKFLRDLTELYDFRFEKDSTLSFSSELNLGIFSSEKFVVFYRGPFDQFEAFTESIKPIKHPFRDSLLSVSNRLVFDPQGMDTIVRSDFMVIDYEYTGFLKFTGEWYAREGVPLARASDSIHFHPTSENELSVFLNLSTAALSDYKNPWLENLFKKGFQKISFDWSKFSSHWNGIFSLHYGGEVKIEETHVETYFDENFNTMEKEVINTVSVPDLGIILGTSQPAEMLNWLKVQPNVSFKKKSLFVPLSPELSFNYHEDNLYLFSTYRTPERTLSDNIILLDCSFKGLRLSGEISQRSDKKISMVFTLKEALPSRALN